MKASPVTARTERIGCVTILTRTALTKIKKYIFAKHNFKEHHKRKILSTNTSNTIEMPAQQPEKQSMKANHNVDFERSLLLGRRSWSHFALYADDVAGVDGGFGNESPSRTLHSSKQQNSTTSKVCKFSTPTWDEVVTTPPTMPQRKVSLLQTFYEEDEKYEDSYSDDDEEEPISPFSSCSTSTSTTITTESDSEFSISSPPRQARNNQPNKTRKFTKLDSLKPPLTCSNDKDRQQSTSLREQKQQQQQRTKKLESILKKYCSYTPASSKQEVQKTATRSSSSPPRLSNFLECNNDKNKVKKGGKTITVDDNGSIESDCDTLILLQIRRKERELERIQFQTKYELAQLEQSEGDKKVKDGASSNTSNNITKNQPKQRRSARKIQKLCNDQMKQIEKDIKKLKREHKKRSSTSSTSKTKSKSKSQRSIATKKSSKKAEKK